MQTFWFLCLCEKSLSAVGMSPAQRGSASGVRMCPGIFKALAGAFGEPGIKSVKLKNSLHSPEDMKAQTKAWHLFWLAVELLIPVIN